jgi:ribosome recycling factor
MFLWTLMIFLILASLKRHLTSGNWKNSDWYKKLEEEMQKAVDEYYKGN